MAFLFLKFIILKSNVIVLILKSVNCFIIKFKNVFLLRSKEFKFNFLRNFEILFVKKKSSKSKKRVLEIICKFFFVTIMFFLNKRTSILFKKEKP